MSTSPSTPSTASSGHTAAAHAQGAGQARRSGSAPTAGGDLFANLLSLLNAGGDTLLLTPDATTAGDAAPEPAAALATTDPAENHRDNPLAALLAWTVAPASPRNPADPGADVPATGTASVGLSISGRVTLPAGDALATPPAAAEAPDTPSPAVPTALTTADLAASPAERGHPGPSPAPATRITAWRSTTTLAHAGGASIGGTAHAAGSRPGEHSPITGRAAEQTAVAQAAVPGAAGADTAAGEGPEAGHGPVTDRPAPAGVAASGPGITGDGTGSMAGGNTDDGRPAHQDASAHAQDTALPDGTAATADTDPLAGWTSPHVRHASVRVGDAGEAPIDIQLSLDGQEVQVSFQTEDAQTRDSLAREAGAALGELLQRSGMELGGVSVGGQSASSQQQAGGQPALPQASRHGTAARTQAEVRPADAPARPAPRRDGGRPLDLFV